MKNNRNDKLLWHPYAEVSCAVIHHDPYNSDYINVEVPDRLSHIALPAKNLTNASVFSDHAIDDARGLIFVTSGKGDYAGAAHVPPIQALTSDGEYLWSCDEWKEADRPSAFALAYLPLVDADGTVYFGDDSCLYAAEGKSGRLLYKKPFFKTQKEREEKGSFPMLSCYFLPPGLIAGVTSNGRLMVFDRATGDLLGDYLSADKILVQEIGDDAAGRKKKRVNVQTSASHDSDDFVTALLSENMWKIKSDETNKVIDYMIKNEMRESFVDALFGLSIPVTNAPAVLKISDNLSRVYFAALTQEGRQEKTKSNNEPDAKLFCLEVLYDAKHNNVSITEVESFQGLLPDAKGCATTPAISPDGTTIYVVDKTQRLYAFSTDSGAPLWGGPVTLPGDVNGSVAVSWEPEYRGALYIAATEGLVIVDPATGASKTVCYHENRKIWEPDDYPGLGDKLRKVAMPDGVVCLHRGKILLPFVLGYKIPAPNPLAMWPLRSVLAVLDYDGNVLDVRELPDVSELGAIADRMGNVYVGHLSAASSATYSMWQDIQHKIPDTWPDTAKEIFTALKQIRPIKPVGGISIFKGTGQNTQSDFTV